MPAFTGNTPDWVRDLVHAHELRTLWVEDLRNPDRRITFYLHMGTGLPLVTIEYQNPGGIHVLTAAGGHSNKVAPTVEDVNAYFASVPDCRQSRTAPEGWFVFNPSIAPSEESAGIDSRALYSLRADFSVPMTPWVTALRAATHLTPELRESVWRALYVDVRPIEVSGAELLAMALLPGWVTPEGPVVLVRFSRPNS